MAINEDHDEYIIFDGRNGRTLEVCNDDVNTHYFVTGVDNNHNNYNINNADYEDCSNNKEYGANYEDGSRANATHEDGANYTKNLPED